MLYDFYILLLLCYSFRLQQHEDNKFVVIVGYIDFLLSIICLVIYDNSGTLPLGLQVLNLYGRTYQGQKCNMKQKYIFNF